MSRAWTRVAANPLGGFLAALADEADGWQGPCGHSREVAALVELVALELGLDEDARGRAKLAARLHDIGKIAVPRAVLQKPGSLTAAEWELVRTHPDRGALIVSLAGEYRELAPIIRDHHERPDASGYPSGKPGELIPVESKIIAVCDAWVAMRSDRPHRGALACEQARAELREGSGTQFDAEVVSVFLELEGRLREAPLHDAVPLVQAAFQRAGEIGLRARLSLPREGCPAGGGKPLEALGLLGAGAEAG